MARHLYDAVVGSFNQLLPGVSRTLARGRSHFEDLGMDADGLVQARIHADMLPLHFQIVTLVHMSAGAIQALRDGSFGAPDLTLDFDYAGLERHAGEALESLAGLEADEFDEIATNNVTFRAGDTVLPFTGPDLLLTFAVPHFYFHVTTAYDILRMSGVPLGKLEFYLGTLRLREVSP